MARTRHATLAHERTILQECKRYPRTISTLAEDTGLNYYTVRNVIERLMKRNEIKITGYVNRAAVYAFNGSHEDKEYLPRVIDIVNKASSKIVAFLSAVGNEDGMKNVQAAKRLPQHTAVLLHLAIQADQGIPVGTELTELKNSMTKDYLYAQNSANFYKQILQEPLYWDTESLKKMVNDKDFNTQTVLESVEYYRRLELDE